MRRSKKLIIIAVLATVVLAGSIGGIALAADNENDGGPAAKFGELFDRVCEIYEQKTGVAIDQAALKDSFTQAHEELRPELPALSTMPKRGEMDREAMQERLQALYDEGKITQEQFENKKAWLEAMPDDLPAFGFRGHIGFRGFGGFGGPCAPEE